MRIVTTLLPLALAGALLPACRTADTQRREAYVAGNETRFEKEILAGKVSRGMSFDEVEATLGPPASRGLYQLADEQTWIYFLKTDYDEPRADRLDPDAPRTDRALHVKFSSGRVVDWEIRMPDEWGEREE